MHPEHRSLDTRAFGLSAGIIAAVLTTVCALALAVAPSATMALVSAMSHLDLSALPVDLTWSGYVISLAGWTFGTGIVFAGGALLYNRFAGAASHAAEPTHHLAAR